MQDYVLFSNENTEGEALALAVSEILPFLQFELHKQLINKIKIMGMNAAFGLPHKFNLDQICLLVL